MTCICYVTFVCLVHLGFLAILLGSRHELLRSKAPFTQLRDGYEMSDVEFVVLKQQSKIMWEHVQNGEWDSVRKYLKSSSGKRTVERTHFNGTTFLSFTVVYSPPIDVVNAMIEIHPGALSTRDARGRLPLHVACACGASKKVIAALIRGYSEAMMMTDSDGRAPLHYSVACYYKDDPPSGENSLSSTRKASFDSIATVLAAAPLAVEIVDRVNGETPLEIAYRMER